MSEEAAKEVVSEENKEEPAPKKAKVEEDVEETKLAALRQVEYYFSDESYPFDEYIKSKVSAEGWIDLVEIAGFPKMKKITEDASVIVAALGESDSVEVSEDGTKLKRKFPTPDADPDAEKTAFCSGFGKADDKAVLEKTVLQWMSKHGTVEKVRALRDVTKGQDRDLDGSAFATFSSPAEAVKAAAANGAVFQGRKLTIYTMPDWFSRLQKKRDAIKKKKDDSDAKKQERKSSVAAKIPPGSVLELTNLTTKVTREIIRDAIKAKSPDLPIKWIDYEKGNPTAFVRFETPDVAAAVLTHLQASDDALLFEDEKPNNSPEEEEQEAPAAAAEESADDKPPKRKAVVALLEGDGHTAYVARAAEAITQSQQKRKHSGGRSGSSKNRRLS